jgi:outer membrane protein assembly factor BamA
MSTGFSYSYDNHLSNALNKKYYRFSIETAGNILQGVNSILGRKKNEEGQYEVGDIPYAQYVKGEFDFAYNYAFDQRNHLVGHINVGLAYPYGNASVVPFEKRFFGGGANGVRGWSVRTLGPGNYYSENLNDFVKQTGDVKLLMNLEYRAKLFWKIEAAVFVDAGNIWTIKDYESQPNGQFKFNRFFKQIALAYGAGIRFDFSYFLIRFDLGLKAYNPSRQKGEQWRFNGLNWKDDCAFHFAIGHPF